MQILWINWQINWDFIKQLIIIYAYTISQENLLAVESHVCDWEKNRSPHPENDPTNSVFVWLRTQTFALKFIGALDFLVHSIGNSLLAGEYKLWRIKPIKIVGINYLNLKNQLKMWK